MQADQPESPTDSPTLANRPGTVFVIGASVRAAAASITKAGFAAHCGDLFADSDLAATSRVTRLESATYPRSAVDWLAAQPPEPWLFTGALENHPDLLEELAASRTLLGGPIESIRAARDPWRVAALLEKARLPVPALAHPDQRIERPGDWLLKPLRSAAGRGVRVWDGAAADPEHGWLQQYLRGRTLSAAFVADGQSCMLTGICELWAGLAWTNAARFWYSGSLFPATVGEKAIRQARRVGSVLSRGLGLRGWFGVDFVWSRGKLWTLEVNPRFTASMELIDGGGPSLFRLHRSACEGDLLAGPHERRHCEDGLVRAKVILYASCDVTVDKAFADWLRAPGDSGVRRVRRWAADIPTTPQPLRAGWPLATLLVEAPGAADALRGLRHFVREAQQHWNALATSGGASSPRSEA